MPEFGWIFPDGRVVSQGKIEQDDINMCPHRIMMFEHYREDGSCRCNDPDHAEMLAWGYVWDIATEKWVAPLDDES